MCQRPSVRRGGGGALASHCAASNNLNICNYSLELCSYTDIIISYCAQLVDDNDIVFPFLHRQLGCPSPTWQDTLFLKCSNFLDSQICHHTKMPVPDHDLGRVACSQSNAPSPCELHQGTQSLKGKDEHVNRYLSTNLRATFLSRLHSFPRPELLACIYDSSTRINYRTSKYTLAP